MLLFDTYWNFSNICNIKIYEPQNRIVNTADICKWCGSVDVFVLLPLPPYHPCPRCSLYWPLPCLTSTFSISDLLHPINNKSQKKSIKWTLLSLETIITFRSVDESRSFQTNFVCYCIVQSTRNTAESVHAKWKCANHISNIEFIWIIKNFIQFKFLNHLNHI